MTATEKSREIARRLGISLDAAHTLRRAELVLHRWSEEECGNGNDYASWAIERDETTGKPFRATYPHRGESYRVAIADREAGALRRVQQVCEANGLHFYHQGDPRGCALYVAREPLDGRNYTNGLAVSV